MKKLAWVLTAALILALVVLVPAIAEDRIDERAHARYRDIHISNDSESSQILDWLDDFAYRELAAAQHAALDLTDYCALIDRNEALLCGLDDSTIRQYADIYFGNDDPNGTWKQTLIRQNTRTLADLYVRFTFFENRLTGLITQDNALRDSIRSGLYGDEDVRRFYAELQQVDKVLEQTRQDAVSFLGGSETNGETPEAIVMNIRNALDSLDGRNACANELDSVQILGAYLEGMAIKARQAKENAGNDGSLPTITIVSTKQFGYTFTRFDKSLGYNVGIPGVEVTVICDADHTKTMTKTSDEHGVVLFHMADFLENADNEIDVLVTYRHTGEAYRRADLGRCTIEGGTVFNLEPVEDDGQPYVVGLKFEDRDMLHIENGMVTGVKDDVEFDIHLEVETHGRKTRVRLDAGESTLLNEAFAPGEASRTIRQKWLNGDPNNTKPHLLPTETSRLSLTVTSDDNGTDGEGNALELFPSFKVEKNWKDEMFTQPTHNALVNGFLGSFAVRVPPNIPIIGGFEIAIPKPLIEQKGSPLLKRFKFQAEPNGHIMISYNCTMMDASKDDEGRKYASRDVRTMEKRQDKEKKSSIQNIVGIKGTILSNRNMSDLGLGQFLRFY